MLFSNPGAVMLTALAVLVVAVCLCAAAGIIAYTVNEIRKMRG